MYDQIKDMFGETYYYSASRIGYTKTPPDVLQTMFGSKLYTRSHYATKSETKSTRETDKPIDVVDKNGNGMKEIPTSLLQKITTRSEQQKGITDDDFSDIASIIPRISIVKRRKRKRQPKENLKRGDISCNRPTLIDILSTSSCKNSRPSSALTSETEEENPRSVLSKSEYDENLNNKQFQRFSTNVQRCKNDHEPTPISATDKKKWPTRRCMQCKKHGVRRESRYYCQECNVTLCREPCFAEFH